MLFKQSSKSSLTSNNSYLWRIRFACESNPELRTMFHQTLFRTFIDLKEYKLNSFSH
jgi:hypothetical protein